MTELREGMIAVTEAAWVRLHAELDAATAHIAAQEAALTRLREIERAAVVLARNIAEVPNHGATDLTVSPSLLMELRAALAAADARAGTRDAVIAALDTFVGLVKHTVIMDGDVEAAWNELLRARDALDGRAGTERETKKRLRLAEKVCEAVGVYKASNGNVAPYTEPRMVDAYDAWRAYVAALDGAAGMAP